MEKNKNPLERYFKILKGGEEKAKFLLCENLEEKVNEAKEILKNCHFCERRCGVNRSNGEKGYCGVLEPRVASEFIHLGEEKELIPSYTIFFSGCTFSCVFCQNWDISQYSDTGVYIKPEILAEMIERRKEGGVRNVNWVGGDPTPNLAYILEVLSHLKKLKVNLPQIWNSNMYLSLEAMNLLDGVIDIYLTDFKYGDDDCAKRLSKVENYFGIITRNHLIAEQQCEMIIRHLVLPNHLECCTKPILKWISKNLKNFRLNIMEQYRPEYNALKFEDISRRLTWDEFQEAIEFAKDLGL
jgi:putative pyruvate formate lyase activating enzyme